MGAVLACGDTATLSHGTAAELWGIGGTGERDIHVSTLRSAGRHRPGIRIHRRRHIEATEHRNIPVTTPTATLVDIAQHLTRDQLEHAIGEADKRKLVDPLTLRAALDALPPQPGRAKLRRTLDSRTFRLTDSALERAFLRLVRQAGLPAPLTGQAVTGYRVDFFWPDLGLVVETDGLTYHRTPAQQARDRLRDQRHTAAGLTPLRFTHEQVRYRPAHVIETLIAVARRPQ
jgi:very-short-patch-repair endonuclease